MNLKPPIHEATGLDPETATEDETMKWSRAESVDVDIENRLLERTHTATARKKISSIAIYTLLISIILLQTILIIHLRTDLAKRPPKTTIFGLKTLRNVPRTSGLQNKFWPGGDRDKDLEAANRAWEAINSGHGAVVVTPEFKAQHALPDSIRHPFRQDVYAYALEAYHCIHCLQVLRKDFLLVREGRSAMRPLEHAMHCFDALRQSVMCQASDELLGITGRGHAGGFNQTRMCRDWDELRDLATEKTACYWDDELPPEKEDMRWAMCDGGYDGLPIGGILE
ncbi:hypothetical protein AC578_3200 [Pseudocercospora eumusae]|uniref:Uncharacterized protein n=1 Tax=Pseudocercospora eumusae TaxID=321146 RepID=A0A139H5V9_9PEZI|nr:hypothetical protein AC578_3200 [Pseudocercospora eumusae]